MAWRAARRQLIAGIAVAGFLGIAPIAQAQLFRPFTDHRTALLEGNWQSCRDGSGEYAERVYDGKWSGLPPFELHLGPNHEFALYRGSGTAAYPVDDMALARAIRTGAPAMCDDITLDRDGVRVPIESHAIPLFDPDGSITVGRRGVGL